MTAEHEPAGLEPDARAMMDAFRQAQAAPAPTRERVWERLEASTTAAPSAMGRIGKGAAVVAVAAGLAWLAWPRPEATTRWSVESDEPAASTPMVQAEAAPSAEPEVPPPSEPAPIPRPAPAAMPPAPAAMQPAPSPSAPAASSPAPASPAKAAPAPERGPTELELIARAKKALARGDAQATLAATGEHERRFASGMLVEERALLEIEARCALGQRDRVETLRGRFLAAHAASPLADRVRHSCKETQR